VIEEQLQTIIDDDVVDDAIIDTLKATIVEIERLRNIEFMYQSVSK
jgi:hypothetical protein